MSSVYICLHNLYGNLQTIIVLLISQPSEILFQSIEKHGCHEVEQFSLCGYSKTVKQFEHKQSNFLGIHLETSSEH